MPPCFCSCNPPSTSITKFISDQPFLSMLETKCKTMKDLKKIHAHLIKTGLAKDIIVASRVLAFCATSRGGGGDINYAYLVFSNIEKPNLFTWNTIIRGFSQSSAPEKAISLFVDMLVNSSISPERLTYPSVFKAYTQLGLARDGAQLHGRIVKLGLEFDPFIRNSVIHIRFSQKSDRMKFQVMYKKKKLQILAAQLILGCIHININEVEKNPEYSAALFPLEPA
ncbi:unnamed protein product [Fraxinus pennsylvanica]|uniref:Pentatricopeptide repeat-containing protein n=1 Tax=Fraxinus pennsylvanica TaxID=56036 RepID=A0AAD2DMV5_9LAMI|nr:unnamed protein product [Fraxinus pennsylvanica]